MKPRRSSAAGFNRCLRLLVTRALLEESAPVDWDVLLLAAAIAAVSA